MAVDVTAAGDLQQDGVDLDNWPGIRLSSHNKLGPPTAVPRPQSTLFQ